MRRTAHASGCAKCGAGAACLAINLNVSDLHLSGAAAEVAIVLTFCLGRIRACRLKAATKWKKRSGGLNPPCLSGLLQAILNHTSPWVLDLKVSDLHLLGAAAEQEIRHDDHLIRLLLYFSSA